MYGGVEALVQHIHLGKRQGYSVMNFFFILAGGGNNGAGGLAYWV
jgi:hypothetical protein